MRGTSPCNTRVYGLVDKHNDTETEMIGMKPKDAIKLKEVPLVARESYPPKEVLSEDGLYRYLLQPGEEHDDQRHRATDRIWSKASYRLREVVESPGNCVMYYLLNGPERAFVSEELMLIPEDGLYRYLLQPGEEHDDQRHRATDRIWSKASYRLREVVESPGNCVMYYLLNGPERAFVSEELMLIPEDTELPLDYIQEW